MTRAQVNVVYRLSSAALAILWLFMIVMLGHGFDWLEWLAVAAIVGGASMVAKNVYEAIVGLR